MHPVQHRRTHPVAHIEPGVPGNPALVEVLDQEAGRVARSSAGREG